MYLVSKTSLIFLATQIGPCDCGCKRHHMEWGEKDGTLPYIRFQCTNMHVFLWHGDFPNTMDINGTSMKKLEIGDYAVEETRKAIKSLSVATQTDYASEINQHDEAPFQFSPKDEGQQVQESIKEAPNVNEKECNLKSKEYKPEKIPKTKQSSIQREQKESLEKELTEAGLWTSLFGEDQEKSNGLLDVVKSSAAVDTYDNDSEEDNGTFFEDLSQDGALQLEETNDTSSKDSFQRVNLVDDSIIRSTVSPPLDVLEVKDSSSEEKREQDLKTDITDKRHFERIEKKLVDKHTKRASVAKAIEKPVLVNPSECYETISGDMSKKPDFEELQEEKIYRCLTCFTLCDSVYAKQKHTNKHIGRYFLCKMCQLRRQTREAIKNHILSAHSWKRYHCETCSYRSAMKARLNQHVMEVHQQNKKFQCTLCEKSFMTKKKLSNHEIIHQKVTKSKIDKQKVELKKEEFSHESVVDENHNGENGEDSRVHIDGEKINLQQIGKEKNASQNIQASERLKRVWKSVEHLEDESENCTVIKSNSLLLDENQNDFHVLETKSTHSVQDISNKNLADFIPNMDALALNYDSFDPLKQPPDGSNVNTDGLDVMPDLGKSFDITKLLESVSQKDSGFETISDSYHLEKRESFKEQATNLPVNMIDNLNVEKSDRKTEETLSVNLSEDCVIKERVNVYGAVSDFPEIIEKRNDSSNENVLKDDTGLDSSAHEDITHTVDKTKKEANIFTCPNPECSKTFKFRANMHRHMQRVHIKDKKFLCEQCGKGFATSADRTSHTKSVHTDIRTFECEWTNCGKTFKSKKTLDVHRRVHEDVKHLQCSLCDYTCRQKTSLDWHMKKKH